MVKSELVSLIASRMPHLPNKQITQMVDLVIKTMSETLSTGKRIEIRGFGSFSLHYHAPREAHNPKTGEKLITRGKHSLHFKPGKTMRKRLNPD